jgi:integral membrane protein
MTPLKIYRTSAIIEAVTWGLLILGMILKYTGVTDAGVSVAGPVHGLAFLAFVVITVLVWVNNRWSVGEGLLGLFSAVVPFATVPFEKAVARRGGLDGPWRTDAAPGAPVQDRMLAVLVGRPYASAGVLAVVVLAVFGTLLVVGPPFG